MFSIVTNILIALIALMSLLEIVYLYDALRKHKLIIVYFNWLLIALHFLIISIGLLFIYQKFQFVSIQQLQLIVLYFHMLFLCYEGLYLAKYNKVFPSLSIKKLYILMGIISPFILTLLFIYHFNMLNPSSMFVSILINISDIFKIDQKRYLVLFTFYPFFNIFVFLLLLIKTKYEISKYIYILFFSYFLRCLLFVLLIWTANSTLFLCYCLAFFISDFCFYKIEYKGHGRYYND